ncbi:helix-turn-helix domain-containing protein [Microbacterium sp. NPDC080220]|uniref:helix-turn-helix domain-containing protein n=1 Tax=Microbacterium sp. NPDC080220 TaxID=3161017 RepID=UPI003429EEED
MTPQHRGLLDPDDRARIIAALKAREDADLALYAAVRAAAENGASVRMMADDLGVSTNTISRWKRTVATSGDN